MNNIPSTLSGDELFIENESIYINLAVESKETNCSFHKHDFIEIAYVNSGRGSHLIGDTRYPVSKGYLSIINYDIPHTFIQNDEDKDGEFTVYNCVFKPEFIHYSLLNSNDFKDITASLLFNTFFLEEGPAISLKLSGGNITEFENMYSKMLYEYKFKPKGYINILRSYLIEMLTKIFRIAEGNVNRGNDVLLNRNKLDIINKAIDFLEENFSSPEINIEEVALRSFLSKGYFIKVFKEITGENYTKYLQNLRISKACTLLTTSDMKIIQIMQEVGFKDIKHFNKLFKNMVGVTPREYRKNKGTVI